MEDEKLLKEGRDGSMENNDESEDDL